MSAQGPGSVRLAVLTLALAVAAVVLGLIGLDDYLRGQELGGTGSWERLYYCAQMFVLGPDPVDEPPFNAPLLVALFLAPATTVLAVLQALSALFHAQWVAARLRAASGHAVVVGAGPEAFVLAQKLADEPAPRRWWHRLAPWRRTWPAATVLVGSDVVAEVARRHDVHVVPGDPLDEKTLRAAGVPGAAQVFAFSDSGAANAGVALRTRTLHAERREAQLRGRRWLPWRLVRRLRATLPGRHDVALPSVAVYARADDPALVALMRARRLSAESLDRDDGYDLDFVSTEQRAARTLLADDDPTLPAAVVGSDQFAEAVEAELRRRHEPAAGGTITRVSIADCARVPADAARVYVSAENPDQVMRTGLQLLHPGDHHVVLCLGRSSALADALSTRLFDDVADRLTVFGVLDAALDPEKIRQGALVERLARALHEHYLRTYGSGGLPGQVPWDRLAEPFRADNRDHAEDIGRKLTEIDAVIVPAQPGLPPFTFDPTPDEDGHDEIERLAIMEHDRWWNTKKATGVSYGPQRSATTHPDCLPWSRRPEDTPVGEPVQLSDAAKEKNRLFVRELPALLAVEGLTIARRTAPGKPAPP